MVVLKKVLVAGTATLLLGLAVGVGTVLPPLFTLGEFSLAYRAPGEFRTIDDISGTFTKTYWSESWGDSMVVAQWPQNSGISLQHDPQLVLHVYDPLDSGRVAWWYSNMNQLWPDSDDSLRWTISEGDSVIMDGWWATNKLNNEGYELFEAGWDD